MANDFVINKLKRDRDNHHYEAEIVVGKFKGHYMLRINYQICWTPIVPDRWTFCDRTTYQTPKREEVERGLEIVPKDPTARRFTDVVKKTLIDVGFAEEPLNI